MARLALLVNTVRYLKLKQLYYQLFYRLRKPKLEYGVATIVRGCISGWPGAAYCETPSSDGVSYTFLGETACLGDDWNSPSFSKLWLYNLHYQDVLNAKSADAQIVLGKKLIADC